MSEPDTTKKYSKIQLRRRNEIADRAISCFAEHGYAETSLRDIAAAAEMNLGRLHYYFDSKADLVVFAIRQYKMRFVEQLTEAIRAKAEKSESIGAVVEVLMESLADAGKAHRVWYDMRTQALFNPAMQPAIAEIQAELEDATKALFVKFCRDADDEVVHTAFLLLDAIFFDALRHSFNGARPNPDLYRARFETTLDTLLAPANIGHSS